MHIIETAATILNKAGLHARAAGVFINKASKFQSKIFIKKSADSPWINGKSILGMLTLGLAIGEKMFIKAEGPDANEAIVELTELINQKFGEEK